MRRLITNFRKNQVNGLLLFSIITLTIFAGVGFISVSNTSNPETYTPQSAYTLDVPWTGTGDPQSARAYIQKTGAEEYQTDDFDISVPTSPSAIHSASINFSVVSSFETTHEFEQDSPLDYPRYIKSSRDSSKWDTSEALSPDSLTINIGDETVSSQGFTGLVDGSEANALILENDTISPADNEIDIV